MSDTKIRNLFIQEKLAELLFCVVGFRDLTKEKEEIQQVCQLSQDFIVRLAAVLMELNSKGLLEKSDFWVQYEEDEFTRQSLKAKED